MKLSHIISILIISVLMSISCTIPIKTKNITFKELKAALRAVASIQYARIATMGYFIVDGQKHISSHIRKQVPLTGKDGVMQFQDSKKDKPLVSVVWSSFFDLTTAQSSVNPNHIELLDYLHFEIGVVSLNIDTSGQVCDFYSYDLAKRFHNANHLWSYYCKDSREAGVLVTKK